MSISSSLGMKGGWFPAKTHLSGALAITSHDRAAGTPAIDDRLCWLSKRIGNKPQIRRRPVPRDEDAQGRTPMGDQDCDRTKFAELDCDSQS